MNRMSATGLLALALLASASVLTQQITAQLSERHFAQANAAEQASEFDPLAPVAQRSYQVQGSATRGDDTLRLDFNF